MTNNYIKVLLIHFALLAFGIACKKEISYKEKYSFEKSNNNPELYTLGIIKANGEVKLLSEFKSNSDLLSYSDLLIYKDEVEPIKIYSRLNNSDLKEIQILYEKYRHNSFVKKTPREGGEDTLFNISTRARVWPNNTVKFTVDARIHDNMKQRIYDAMHEWTSKTNIRFTQYPFVDENQEGLTHIMLDEDDSFMAKSDLGAPSSVRAKHIYLGDAVGTHVIIHELGHALGFIHEHQRPSRDMYLHINDNALNEVYDAIGQDQEFKKEMEGNYTNIDPVYSDTFQFDYKSIMIYASYGNHMSIMGSKDPGNALRKFLMQRNLALYTRKDNNGIIDLRFDLSELDSERTNKVYPMDTCPAR